MPNVNALLRLWVHEALRVFADRFVSIEDHEAFVGLLSDTVNDTFSLKYSVLANEFAHPIHGPVFTDLMSPAERESAQALQEVRDVQPLKAFLEAQLLEHNARPGLVPMDLVIFQDALLHTCRIARIVSQPRGHALLIGVGGSGRRSLARLARYGCCARWRGRGRVARKLGVARWQRC